MDWSVEDGEPGIGYTVSQGSSLTSRAFAGLVWQFGGTTGRGLLQVGFLTVLARLLTPEDFGIVGAALIVVGLSSLFSQFGVGPALVHQQDLRTEHIRVGFSITLSFSVVAALIVLFAAPAAAAFFRMPELRHVLMALAVVFVLRGVGVVAESLLQRELRFQELALVDLSSYAVGYGCVGIALGFLGFGYWSLVIGHLAQSALQTAGLLYMRPHPMRPSADVAAARSMLRYGSGITLARLGNYAAGQGDNLIVGRILGPVALGVYGRAYSLLVTPAQLFGSVIDRVLFPSMATIKDDRDRLARVHQRAVGAVALLSLPASGLAAVLAPEIVASLLGAGWSEVIVPLQVFSVGILARTSYKISDSVVRATGKVYQSAWRQGIYAAMVFVGAGFGSQWGVPGVSVGVLLAISGHFVVMAALSMRITGLQWRHFLGAHVPGLRLACVTTAVAHATALLLRWLGAPAVIVAVAVPLLIVWLVRNLLTFRWPLLFLGPEGLWMRNAARANLPPRLFGLISR